MIVTEAAYAGMQNKNRMESYVPSKLMLVFVTSVCTMCACTCLAAHSRVLLLSSLPESTYINANYIKVRKVANKILIMYGVLTCLNTAIFPKSMQLLFNFYYLMLEATLKLTTQMQQINEVNTVYALYSEQFFC